MDEAPCVARSTTDCDSIMRQLSGIGVTSYCHQDANLVGALARQAAEIKQTAFAERNAAKNAWTITRLLVQPLTQSCRRSHEGAPGLH